MSEEQEIQLREWLRTNLILTVDEKGWGQQRRMKVELIFAGEDQPFCSTEFSFPEEFK